MCLNNIYMYIGGVKKGILIYSLFIGVTNILLNKFNATCYEQLCNHPFFSKQKSILTDEFVGLIAVSSGSLLFKNFIVLI